MDKMKDKRKGYRYVKKAETRSGVERRACKVQLMLPAPMGVPGHFRRATTPPCHFVHMESHGKDSSLTADRGEKAFDRSIYV